MAVGNPVMIGAAAPGQLVVPVSAQALVGIGHDDLTATSQTSTVLARPQTTVSANVHPVPVPPGAVRVDIFGRYPQASTLTTSPVVRLYAAIPFAASAPYNAEEFSFPDDGTWVYRRIDALSGAGVTVTLDTTNDHRDATYKYTASPLAAGYDCLGGTFIFALTETAAVISAGSMQLMFSFRN